MSGPGLTEPVRWRARRIRASGSSILLAFVAIVAVVLARGLFLAASQPIGWVAAAAATALVLSPVIELQARRIPRGIAIIATVLVGVIGVASVGAGLFLEVQDQLGQLREQLPAAAAELEEGAGDDSVLAQLELSTLVQDLVDQTADGIAPDASIEEAVGTVPAYLVSAVLVIFFLVWGGALLDGLERQISDPERRDRISQGAATAAHLTQHYVVAAIALAALVAVVGGAVAWWVGLPTPLVLGVVLGAASLIPYIGVLFGSVPMLLLSAASEAPGTTVALGVALVAMQMAVTAVTRGVIERRTLRVGPAVIVVGAVVGSDLYGIGGALVTVLAGILAVAAIEAWRRDQATGAPPQQDLSPGPAGAAGGRP